MVPHHDTVTDLDQELSGRLGQIREAGLWRELRRVDCQNDIQPDPLRLVHLESALRASRSSRMTRLAISICRPNSGS